MRDSFSSYHPFINMIYFAFVLIVAMFFMHPVYAGIGLICSVMYQGRLLGWKKVCRTLFLFTIPMMTIVTLMNPIFNHYGVTIILYLNNGNPVTLESMVYGLLMGMTLFQVTMWFGCCNEVMTSDKLIHIFGRILPNVSLVLSMSMRFIPKFKSRMAVINSGQKSIGRDVSNGNVLKKVRQGVISLSILVTWSLENAIMTADSMRSRGYGQGRRTSFSIYRFDKRDRYMLCIMAALMGCVAWGAINGYTKASYNPRIIIKGIPMTWKSFMCFASYAFFCLIPVLSNIIEDLKWKALRKNIAPAVKGEYRLWSL